MSMHSADTLPWFWPTAVAELRSLYSVEAMAASNSKAAETFATGMQIFVAAKVGSNCGFEVTAMVANNYVTVEAMERVENNCSAVPVEETTVNNSVAFEANVSNENSWLVAEGKVGNTLPVVAAMAESMVDFAERVESRTAVVEENAVEKLEFAAAMVESSFVVEAMAENML